MNPRQFLNAPAGSAIWFDGSPASRLLIGDMFGIAADAPGASLAMNASGAFGAATAGAVVPGAHLSATLFAAFGAATAEPTDEEEDDYVMWHARRRRSAPPPLRSAPRRPAPVSSPGRAPGARLAVIASIRAGAASSGASVPGVALALHQGIDPETLLIEHDTEILFIKQRIAMLPDSPGIYAEDKAPMPAELPVALAIESGDQGLILRGGKLMCVSLATLTASLAAGDAGNF